MDLYLKARQGMILILLNQWKCTLYLSDLANIAQPQDMAQIAKELTKRKPEILTKLVMEARVK